MLIESKQTKVDNIYSLSINILFIKIDLHALVDWERTEIGNITMKYR
jgi:hypothetical protein